MSDLSLSSVGGLASGAGDLIGKADPLGNLIDVGASLLGLPPEAKNVVKIAVGAIAADPVLIVSGSVGLAGNVMNNTGNASPPATTEYTPPQGSLWCAGYARTPFGPPADDGLPPLAPLLPNEAARGGTAAPAVPSAKAGPANADATGGAQTSRKSELFQQAEKLAGTLLGGAVLASPGTQGPSEHPATGPDKDVPVSQAPAAGGKPATAPELLEYRECLEVLRSNYDTFDAADSPLIKDGLISRPGLLSVMANPNNPEELRKAARFLLDHPDYFNRLDQAAGIWCLDGFAGRLDLDAEILRVDSQLAVSEPEPEAPVYGGNTVTPGQGHLRNILGDPSLSIEEKLLALLEGGLRAVDQELTGMMDQLVKLQTRKGGTKDAKKAGELDTQMQLLQFRIQRAVERRSQMFQMMSTLSEKFNEMAKVAIQNMGRA